MDTRSRDLQETELRRKAVKLLGQKLGLAGMTQEEVGRLLNISQSIVSSWLRGTKLIPRERIEDLARELPSPQLAAIAEQILRLRLGGVEPERAADLLSRVREIVGGER